MSFAKFASIAAVSAYTAVGLAGPALADGLMSRSAIAAPETRPCAVSGTAAITTDYVTRGVSQNNENPALQASAELACGKFYLGVWGSNVEQFDGTLEVDISGGYRTTTGPIAWDLGFIYYTYPGASSRFDLDYFEVKVGASGDIWKGGTLGGTVYYSPEYTTATGPVWTLEGTFSQVLPKVAIFSPTFSATIGTSLFADNNDLNYTYWNVGLALGFREKWALDLRYWDTDGEGFVGGSVAPLSDERFVATVKYTF